MTGPAVAEDQRALLVDSLRAAERACAKAQARRAQLMVQISHALRKLERADSTRMLNLVVVAAARP